MNSKMRKINVMFLLVGLLFVGLIVLNGCKKSEPATSTEEAGQVAADITQQTVCPVMEAPINKDLFTEYKGKKVYFCCPGCKEKFEKEPEKYLAKLPQFKD